MKRLSSKASPTGKTKSSSKPALKRASSSLSPRGGDVEGDVILHDVKSADDLFHFTATDIIRKLVAAYCSKFDTSHVTSYMLSLLLESLVPTAPAFAKEQAQNQLAQMSGAVGQHEAIELVRFVQAAGRVNNQVLVENGEQELARLATEAAVVFSSGGLGAGDDGAEGKGDEAASAPDGVLMVGGVRGSLDTRIVPAASTTLKLRAKCEEQERKLEEQSQRIRELEATLNAHRPVFEAVEAKQALDNQPDVVIKKAAKRGTLVVKKSKSAVSFVGGQDDADAVAAATASATDASGGPLQTSGPVPKRFESSREEVIATARWLAAEARQAKQAASSLIHQTDQPDVALTGNSARSPGRAPPAFMYPYVHHVTATDYSTLQSRSANPYSHLGSAPLLGSAASAGEQIVSSSLPSPHHLDVIPPTQQHLTSQDVIRLISDKRPLSAQAQESFSSWYQEEQAAKVHHLLDRGESDLVATITQNCALSSRLSGSAHILALERQYTKLNRGPPLQQRPLPASSTFASSAVMHHQHQQHAVHPVTRNLIGYSDPSLYRVSPVAGGMSFTATPARSSYW